MPDLIYNVKFNIDDNLQEGVAGAERYEQQVEQLEMQVAELTAQLKKATGAQKGFNAGNKTAGGTLGRTNKQLAIGNQLFFSLSDGIQDSAQFSQGFSTGMRAIGNNIGFTAELMTMYVAQTAALNGGTKSLSATMKALGGSLMGAGGLILALNTALTLITVFSQRSKKAEKDVETLGDAFVSASNDISSTVFGESSYLLTGSIIGNLGNEFSRLSKQIDESTGFFKNMSNAFINGLDSMRLVSDETYRNSEAGRVFGQQQKDNAVISKVSIEQRKQLISVTAEKIGVDEKEAKAILETVAAETEEIRKKERMRRAIIALIPEARDYYEIQEETSRVIDEFNLGIGGGIDALEIQKTSVENLIDQYKDLYEAGNEELLPFLVELNEIYKNLSSTLDKTAGSEGEYSFIKTQLNALQLEEAGVLNITSSTREQIIGQVEREIVAVNNSAISLEEKVEKLNTLYSILKDLKNLGSDSIFRQIEQDAQDMFLDFSDEQADEYADNYAQLDKEMLRNRLNSLRMEREEYERIQRERLEVTRDLKRAEADLERETQDTRVNIVSTAAQAMSSLSMGFAKENKAASLVFLAIEQGLRIAQVSMSTNQTIAQLQQSASAAYGKAAAAYAGTGALGAAIAGGMAAQPILAQIPLAKASGTAAIAAIAAATIGRGAQILGGGGGTGSSGSGGSEPSEPFGFQMNQIGGQQRFMSPSFTPQGSQGQMQPKVEVKVLADRKKLYYMVKQGEEEYRSIKA